MELTPFNPQWADSGSKLDLHAIYRRPGQGINLTSPLPVRRHTDWQKKGYQFVTLASGEDVNKVMGFLQEKGVDLAALRKSYDGPPLMRFKVTEYVKELSAQDADQLAELQAKVEKFGADAVVEMMRVSDPSYTLPASIKVPIADGKGKK